ncbi:terminase small subunit [Candidatus Bipolaricaulota bacterium]
MTVATQDRLDQADTTDRGAETRPLTAMQQAFVTHYVAGESARGAALLAGYAESVANTATANILDSPYVREAVRNLQDETRLRVARRLAASVERSVKVIEEIRDDETVAARERLAASKALLDRAGHGASDPLDLPGGRSDLDDFFDSAP